MDLNNFKEIVSILSKGEGNELRKRYLEKFINTDNKLFQEQIQSKHKFIDGYCYLGYLWDYIKNPVIIEKEYINKIAEEIDEVYVFWDIHSCERIFMEDYWKFDKDAILRLKFKILLQGLEYLPEDIYIFDESMMWTLIKTHEEIEGKCYCLKSGDI